MKITYGQIVLAPGAHADAEPIDLRLRSKHELRIESLLGERRPAVEDLFQTEILVSFSVIREHVDGFEAASFLLEHEAELAAPAPAGLSLQIEQTPGASREFILAPSAIESCESELSGRTTLHHYYVRCGGIELQSIKN